MSEIHPRRRRAPGRAGGARAACLAVTALVLLAWGCHSPVAPANGEADITITSHWNVKVNVYMDGVFKFPLDYKESAELDNVTVTTHHLEAHDAVTDAVVASEDLAVTDRSEYTWTIEHRARINIDSDWLEPLHIYMDGVYQFDLAEGENHWIINVPLGTHFLMATRAGDDQEVCSVTAPITDNQDYGWGISPSGNNFTSGS